MNNEKLIKVEGRVVKRTGSGGCDLKWREGLSIVLVEWRVCITVENGAVEYL